MEISLSETHQFNLPLIYFPVVLTATQRMDEQKEYAAAGLWYTFSVCSVKYIHSKCETNELITPFNGSFEIFKLDSLVEKVN